MVIVFDMRSGEVIDYSAPARGDTPHQPGEAPERPRVSAALQLVEYGQKTLSRQPPPAVLMGCYFDENGE